MWCQTNDDGLVKVGDAGNGETIDREAWEIRCTDEKDVRKMECGIIPLQAIYSLRAGVNRLLELGMDKVGNWVSHCFETVYCGLETLDYDAVTPFKRPHRCHSIVFRMERNQEMVDFCLERGVFFSKGRDGHVRVSVAPFTTEEDVKRLLQVVAEWKETQ